MALNRLGGTPARTRATRIAVVAICLACSQCTGNTPTTPTGPKTPTGPTTPVPPVTPNPNPLPPPVHAPQTFSGAGDIAVCAGGNHEATARLLDSIGGTIFTLGDNAYMEGTERQYRECYNPSWGRFKNRTRPAPGNHEYVTPAATPYYEYFGADARNPETAGLGYYSFDLGAWHIVSLNSEVAAELSSAQGRWLSLDLAANTLPCTLAYWHKPLFSSGPNGDHPHMRPFWRLLYESGAEIVLSGHDHLYERFAPQDADGRFDSGRGIREFIVGTGGVPLYPFRATKPNSEVRLGASHGILRLTLLTNSYDYEFIPVAGARERDSGSGACH